MERKGKIIIGVIVVIIAIIAAGALILSNSDVTLMANDATITLPSKYTIDDKGVASSDNVSVLFTPVSGGSAAQEKAFFQAIKDNGKDAGYKNISKTKINGYTVYDYSANPDKLKNVSSNKEYSGDTTSWMTYTPYLAYDGVTTMDVDHFRMVSYMKDDNVYYLTFFTDNPDTSLYSSEIDQIINSFTVESN